MPCAVCSRQALWYGYDPHLARLSGNAIRLCSRSCQDIAARKQGMIDPTEHEIAAMEAAGQQAGEYLDSIAKTDLAAMAEDEWMTLIEVIVTGYTDGLRELADVQPVPA